VADDPEATELALLVLAIAVRVDERVLDLLLRVRVVRALEAPVALRLLENLAALLARVDGTLDAGHRLPLSKESLDDVRVGRGDRLFLTERALQLRRLGTEVVALTRLPARQLSRPGHPKLLLCSRASLQLRHLV